MHLDFAAATDCGRKRSRNEDDFLVARLDAGSPTIGLNEGQIPDLTGGAGPLLLVVADGMGGLESGHLASRLVTRHFSAFAAERKSIIMTAARRPAILHRLLASELQKCHYKMQRQPADSPDRPGSRRAKMGSTATVAMVAWPMLFVAHVGDSRCLLQRRGRLRQLTKDHSVAQYLIDQGALSRSQAQRSPYQHLLWNSLGSERRRVDVDFHEHRLEPGDNLLLCTDGLSSQVPTRQMAKHLSGSGGAKKVCQRLVSSANQRGGPDNITCAVARFSDPASAISPLNRLRRAAAMFV